MQGNENRERELREKKILYQSALARCLKRDIAAWKYYILVLIHVQLVVTAVSYKNVVVVSLVGFAKISISISWGCTILQIFMKKIAIIMLTMYS